MENNELIIQWETGLRIRHIAHALAYSYYNRVDKRIGLFSTLLSAIVATAIFASISKSTEPNLMLIAGGISILSTMFAAANSFLKYGELAERHNKTVASFGSLRRELETALINQAATPITPEKLQELNMKWTELEKTSPALPQRIYNKALKRVKVKP